MYLSMFAMEEAKHTEMFRRWFDAVGLDPALARRPVRARSQACTAGRPAAPRRLRRRAHPGDAPARHRPVAAGHPGRVPHLQPARRGRHGDRRLPALGADLPAGSASSPALRPGLKLTQRDERRHIAYGTYLGRRVLAENPELWEWLEQRWAKLTAGLSGGYGASGRARRTGAPGRGDRRRSTSGCWPAPAGGARRGPHHERHRGGRQRRRGVRARGTPARELEVDGAELYGPGRSVFRAATLHRPAVTRGLRRPAASRGRRPSAGARTRSPRR